MNRTLPGTAHWLALVAAIFLHSPSSRLAAAEKKTSTPPCSVRVWIGHLGDIPAVRVRLKSSAKKGAPLDLVPRATPYRLGDYAEVSPGNRMLEIHDAGSPKQPLATLSVQFAPASFTTLLIQQTAGKVNAVIIDDTVGDQETATLTVRNLAPQLTRLNIQAGPDIQARFASPAGLLQAGGLPRSRLVVETSGDESTGQELHWTSDIDFSKVPRATVVVLPDAYGRLRSRVMVDGQAEAIPASDGASKPGF